MTLPGSVFGVDIGLRRSAVAVIRSDGSGEVDNVTTAAPRDADLLSRWLSVSRMTQQILDGIYGQVAMVLIEQASYGSTGGKAHDRSGAWWGVVTRLLRRDILVAQVPPACRAKYATGSGRADKTAVVRAVTGRCPHLEFSSDDQADAWILAVMGADQLGRPVLPMPELNRLALHGVAWPDAAVAA